jgi:lipopolysaccharide exporter
MKHSRLFQIFNRVQGKTAVLSGLAPQVFAVLNFVMAAHWLAPDALGTWAMFLTLVSFVEMARLGLVQAAVVYFWAKHDGPEKGRIAGASLFLILIFNLLSSLLIAGIAWALRGVWHFSGLQPLLLMYVGVGVGAAFLRWFDVLQTARLEFGGILKGALIYGFSYGVALIGHHVLYGSIDPHVLLLLQVPAVLVTIFFRLGAISVTMKQLLFSVKWVLEIWRFGRFGLGSSLSSMLFQRADVLLLGALATPAGLAAYNIATRIVTWLDLPLNALSQSIFPKIAGAFHREGMDGLTKQCEQSIAVLLGVSLPMLTGAFIGADWLVHLLAGAKYPEAAGLLRILLLAGFAKPWGRLLGLALDASGRPNMNFGMITFSLIINLLLLWPLAAQFGIWGAALATTLGVMITTLTGRLYFRKQIPLSSRRTVQQVWKMYRAFA